MRALPTTRYTQDLLKVGAAYATACKSDLSHLVGVLSHIARGPLVTVGSGGSFASASIASFLHEFHTHTTARTVTPLELISTRIDNVGLICFSASGKNKDICTSFKLGAIRELRPLVALTLTPGSPLQLLGETFSYSDVVCVPSKNFRDGFLAAASLVATAVLLVRAYRELVGDPTQLPKDVEDLIESTVGIRDPFGISELAKPVVSMTSVSVLHTTALKPAAMDLESRFVEAALGALHTSDFRNFGHGRHHWLAKRAKDTGVLALIGDNQHKLAHRTLGHLPSSSPVISLQFSGARDVQALAGLVVSLFVAEAAGRAVGVDPAKPGVPAFGRRIYRLGPGAQRSELTGNRFQTVVRRKSPSVDLSKKEPRRIWLRAYKRAISTLETKRFSGIVFDYDGTLCDWAGRYSPLSGPIVGRLVALLENGCPIGVATGRGGSAGDALRHSLPESLWHRVVVGYYNGSIIAPLANEDGSKSTTIHDSIQLLRAALSSNPMFSQSRTRVADRQLTIHLKPTDSPVELLESVDSTIRNCKVDAKSMVSDHSIDVVLADVSKLRVVEAVVELAGAGEQDSVLRIGDKGRWPGNDAELLNSPCGLSVSEASSSTECCWALSPPGILGVQATVYYLTRFEWSAGCGRLALEDHRGRDFK